jgi:predicted enzyme related to lactoylglutathione lyase
MLALRKDLLKMETTPIQLEIGQTYYMVTYADAKQTMPGLQPLVYIGHGRSNGKEWFQDTISYVLYGSRLEMQGDQPPEMEIYFIEPESVGSSITTLAAAAQAVRTCAARAIELEHPKLPVLGDKGWVCANPPAVRDMLVNLDVPDLQAAIRFYEQGLGLTLERRLFDNTVAEMEGGPVPLYLIEKPAGSAATPQTQAIREYGRHWTPLHLDYVVHELEPSMRRAIAAGATLESGPEEFFWGRQATLSDPFGHGFCLLQ